MSEIIRIHEAKKILYILKPNWQWDTETAVFNIAEQYCRSACHIGNVILT